MSTLLKNSRQSPIARTFRILSKPDRHKLFGITILQVCMSGLDLLGVFLVGILGALSVTGLQSGTSGNRVNLALSILHISSLTLYTQIFLLGSAAVFLLIGRTLLSIYFMRKILFFLSRRGAVITSNLVTRLLSQPLLVVQTRTSQETLYAVTTGVSLLTLQVLATTTVLISDMSLLIVLAIGLFIVDPKTAVAIFIILFLLGYGLHRFMHVRAGELGRSTAGLEMESNGKIVEVFSSYRETVVRNRRDYYAREIGLIRLNLANTAAEMNFLPYVSKYVFETGVIVGALFVTATQVIFYDAAHAVANLAIFLVAGTRIAPAALRIQQASIVIRSSLGQATPTLSLIESLGNEQLHVNVEDKLELVHRDFRPEIVITNISYTYPNALKPAISEVSLKIPEGAIVAIVGPSGAGKTTLVDVILGVLAPDEGTILVSGVNPLSAFSNWPGAVSYVPQDIVISNGTVRQNVALGYPLSEAVDKLVIEALEIAQLRQFISSSPEGLDTQVGERGTKLSGGQRQRLGIARAMFTKPNLLILDEATSSLDGETEADISIAIQALRGTTTVLMIAHRLSTVRDADILVYMNNGKIQATGTFSEVRTKIADFDMQAKLMGL